MKMMIGDGEDDDEIDDHGDGDGDDGADEFFWRGTIPKHYLIP